MSGLDDLFGGNKPNPELLAEVKRIRNAVELIAALQAREFFENKQSARNRLDAVIQKLATAFIREAE